MNRSIAIIASAVAAVALTCSTADAHWRHGDKRVKAVKVGAGVVSTVTYGSIIGWSWTKHSVGYNWGAFGYVTAGCIVLSPIVATAIMNRPVTPREFWTLTGSCVIPIVGGMIAESIYDANNPQPVAMRHHRKKKMMM
jgi:hypothetical protein